MRYHRDIPGVGLVGMETGVLSAPRVYVNQQLAPRRGVVVTLPTPGGGTQGARLGNSLLAVHPSLALDGTTYTFAEEPPTAAKVVALFPLAVLIVVVGGAVGGGLGMIAVLVNRWFLAQQNWSMTLRWATVVAMVPVSYLVGVGVIQAIASFF